MRRDGRLYRYWATLHHQLVPFISARRAGVRGRAGADAAARRRGELGRRLALVLGDAFLVAPILDDTGIRDVALPAGSRWIDWWSAAVHDGGTTLAAYDSTDRSRIPLFVKEGAVIPLEVGDDSTSLGATSSAGRLTVLAYPSTTRTTFTLHEVGRRATAVVGRARRDLDHGDAQPRPARHGGAHLDGVASGDCRCGLTEHTIARPSMQRRAAGSKTARTPGSARPRE